MQQECECYMECNCDDCKKEINKMFNCECILCKRKVTKDDFDFTNTLKSCKMFNCWVFLF